MSYRSVWLKAKQRESYRFIDYFGKEIEITSKTRCVKAIHTRDSLNKRNDGKRKYYQGDDAKSYAVSENGYLLSFKNHKNPVSIGSQDKNTRYVNVWGTNSEEHDTPEKLHRVVWYSFAMDASANEQQFPSFLLEDDTDMITMSSDICHLSRKKIKDLMKMPPHSHNGCTPPVEVPYQYVVHHFNEDRTDNSIKNLILMPWWLHNKYKYSLHEMQNELQKDRKALGGIHYAVVHNSNGKISIFRDGKWGTLKE